MNDGRRRSEQRNEFVQMNLLKMAIPLSEELQGKLVNGWRGSYLKKAWTGKMDHICKEQNFSHSFHSSSAHSLCKQFVSGSKIKTCLPGHRQGGETPLWSLQWSRNLTTTGKCLKRHHLPGRQTCPGSSQGLIWSKETWTERFLSGDFSRAVEEPVLLGKRQSLVWNVERQGRKNPEN